MHKTKSILFEEKEVIEAVNIENKTLQIKREIKIPPEPILDETLPGELWTWYETPISNPIYAGNSYKMKARMKLHCPYGKIGDKLWVKETFYIVPFTEDYGNYATEHYYKRPDGYFQRVMFRADGWKAKKHSYIPWRSPKTLPEWASRISLEIININVEGEREEWNWIIDFDILSVVRNEYARNEYA